MAWSNKDLWGSMQPSPAPAPAPAAISGPGQILAGAFSGWGDDPPETYSSAPGTTFDGTPDNTEITDPRDFIYGREPDFAHNHGYKNEVQANIFSDQFYNRAGQADALGQHALQDDLSNYRQLWNRGQGNFEAADANAAQQLQYGRALYQQGNAEQSAENAARNQQLQLASNIAGQGGDSASQAQLQSGLNAAQASNLALARSGRGWGQTGAAMGQAIDQNAAAGQNAANNAALLRLQAQQSGASIFGQAGQQAQAGAFANHQAALGAYGQQQQQSQAAALANQAAAVGQSNAGYQLGLQGQQLGGQELLQGQNQWFAGENASKAFNDAQQQSDLTREQLGQQQYATESGVQTSNAQMSAQHDAAIAGALGTIVGGVGGAFIGGPAGAALGATAGGAAGGAIGSDARAKTNVTDAEGHGAGGEDLADTFGNLHGYSYNYLDPERFGGGRRYGLMAQELAASPAGSTAVVPDHDGTLMVDPGRLAMMNAPVTGQHERRLSDVEARLDAMLDRARVNGERPPTLGQIAASQGTPIAVPTARFADAHVPTARFADVPDRSDRDAEVIPIEVGSAESTPWGDVDIAALDEAQRRQGGVVNVPSYYGDTY